MMMFANVSISFVRTCYAGQGDGGRGRLQALRAGRQWRRTGRRRAGGLVERVTGVVSDDVR